MQYLLNQTEYDEYVALKENKEANTENDLLKDIVSFTKSCIIEKLMLPSFPSQDQYRLKCNGNDIPESIKHIIDMQIYNGIAR